METANRIKMIQTSWSDDDSVSRAETIRQEVARALEEFPESERRQRVEALRMHFPAWDKTEVKVVEVEKEGPPRKLSPEELVEELAAAFPILTIRQREEISHRLLEAGFKIEKTSREESVPPIEVLPDATARKLGLKSPVRVYPTQLFNVFHELLDCVVRVGGVAQEIFQELHGRAGAIETIGREEGVKQVIARYLSEDPDSSSEEVSHAIGKVRMQLVSMLKIPGALPEKLCERMQVISPESIEGTVEHEDAGGAFARVFKDKKVRCWEKYIFLWRRDALGQTQGSPFWDSVFAKSVLEICDDHPRKP